jgi:hypothetical protein
MKVSAASHLQIQAPRPKSREYFQNPLNHFENSYDQRPKTTMIKSHFRKNKDLNN